MPLTEKGQKIKENMKEEYGSEKGEKVFYASKNAGKITGVDKAAFRDAINAAMARGVSTSDALSAGLRRLRRGT